MVSNPTDTNGAIGGINSRVHTSISSNGNYLEWPRHGKLHVTITCACAQRHALFFTREEAAVQRKDTGFLRAKARIAASAASFRQSRFTWRLARQAIPGWDGTKRRYKRYERFPRSTPRSNRPRHLFSLSDSRASSFLPRAVPSTRCKRVAEPDFHHFH